jgi:hypothetical protein
MAVNANMKYDFAKCKYTAAELKGKTVDVHIPVQGGGTYDGEAKFDARQNEDGLVQIAVIYSVWERDMSSVKGMTVFVPSESFDKIVKNPPGSKCEFSLDVRVRVNSDYMATDLHGKLVDYALRSTTDGHLYGGVGRLVVSGSGTVGIGVLRPGQGPGGYSTIVSPIFHIPSCNLSKLVRNPPGSKNPFSFRDS